MPPIRPRPRRHPGVLRGRGPGRRHGDSPEARPRAPGGGLHSPADRPEAEAEAAGREGEAAPAARGRSSRPRRPGRTRPTRSLAQLSYVIVNEAGASVYSASPVGKEEFPELDATTRGTVSIGRRLQDPLSELVKIEPQNIGVGLYQHDVNPKQLKESLETVIESCVNFVGVDLNTASVPLLRHVSGLNALTARRLVERRGEQGPFTRREQIKRGRGHRRQATFTQAAGFLKIRDGGAPARPHLGPPRELPGGRRSCWRQLGFDAGGHPRQGKD